MTYYCIVCACPYSSNIGLSAMMLDIYSPKVLVIPRNRWLRLNMTEKLFTGTLNHNQNKTKQNKTILYRIKLLRDLLTHKITTEKFNKPKIIIYLTRSPNSNPICLTGVSQYGPVFDGFFITGPKNVSKNSFS